MSLIYEMRMNVERGCGWKFGMDGWLFVKGGRLMEWEGVYRGGGRVVRLGDQNLRERRRLWSKGKTQRL